MPVVRVAVGAVGKLLAGEDHGHADRGEQQREGEAGAPADVPDALVGAEVEEAILGVAALDVVARNVVDGLGAVREARAQVVEGAVGQLADGPLEGVVEGLALDDGAEAGLPGLVPWG